MVKGLDVHLNFLDVTKAFGQVYHDWQLYKLKRIGVAGSFLILVRFKSCLFFQDRKQRVVLNAKESLWRNVKCWGSNDQFYALYYS